MANQRKFYRRLASTFWLIVLLAGLSWPQNAEQKPPAATPPVVEKSAGAAQSGEDAQPPQPQGADEIFRSIQEILKFASQDTGLPIKREVKPKLTSRDEVVAYLEKNMAEDKDARRLRRSELVLKKFGLLPRDFDLGRFLVQLLREQVAGYYDPKTKVVNLLNWVDIEQQRTVMAHELTHALQDQSFGLEKWMRGGGDLAENKREPTAEEIANDESSTARQAVVEGQAMAVLVDYMLAPTGQSLLDSPQIVAALKAGMLVGTADSVEFRNAPLFLKEALTFPYRYGLDFETAVLTKGGKDKAFAGMFANPPRSTRQIMEPATYLSGERVEPLPMPDFKRILKNYDRFDVGAVGEFDVAVIIDQYAGSDASHELYPSWRGGYYYAVRPKADASAPLGLVYVSRWSNVEHAAEFGAIYAKSLLKRYQHVHDVGNGGKDAAETLADLQTLAGVHTFLTEEGPVVIEVKGDTMLVTESLDEAASVELQRAVFGNGAAKNGP